MPAIIISGATGGSSASVVWQAVKPTVTASGSAAGYPAINVTDSNTWNGWKGNANNSTITFDFGSSYSFDGIGIAAHELFTSGTTRVGLQTSNNGSSWSTTWILTPSSNDDLFFMLPTTSARYVRLFLEGTPALIGIIQVGKRLIFPYAPLDDYVPIYYGRKYTKIVNESLRGQWLSNRVVAAGAQTEVDLGPLSRTWVDTNVRGFKDHYDQGGTFFYASCPNKYPNDMGYCKAPETESTMDIVYTEGSRLATVNFGIRAYVAQ